MISRYERVFNTTHPYIGVLEPDGTLIEVNPAALDFGDVKRGDVIGRKFWEVGWFGCSEGAKRQVRADVRDAADGESVRHELEVRVAGNTTIIDFSLQPVIDTRGDVTRLIAEGHDITPTDPQQTSDLAARPGQSDADLLVSYSRDANEPMSRAILHTFLAINVDVFEKDKALDDQVNTDALNAFDWGTDRPRRFTTRLWGRTVEASSDEVRIYDDSSDAQRSNPGS